LQESPQELTLQAASEDELYELIDKVDQCEIARRDKADAEILLCKADFAREKNSERSAELMAREHQLIVANRDLCAQYQKEKADLRSAFENANMSLKSPTVSATPTRGTDTSLSRASSPRKKRFKKPSRKSF
jgi:hypothetical protein